MAKFFKSPVSWAFGQSFAQSWPIVERLRNTLSRSPFLSSLRLFRSPS